MRITNSMMSNNVMLNINRNALNVDRLYQQMASTKLITFPSDNPLIATRSLKFRTMISQNEQYQRNVDQAKSWMELTDDGLSEVTNIIAGIQELITDADGIETYADKKNTATQIQSLLDQLGLVMNKSYAGRYAFSGYRTDEPGALLNDDATLKYTDITQNFTKDDLEITKVYHFDSAGNKEILTNVAMLKLPYTGIDETSVKINNGSTTITPTFKTLGEHDAYSPGPNDINFIPETGELIFGENMKNTYIPCEIKYDKEGFEQGDINPKVYFTCTDADGVTYDMDDQDIVYEFSVGTAFPVNCLAKDTVTANLIADLMNLCQTVERMELTSEADLKALYSGPPHNLTGDDLTDAINKALEDEKALMNQVLADRFNNMIGLMDRHANTVGVTQTDLGARIIRIDFIETRLKDDNVTYKTLLSKNEDTNLIDTAMYLKNAEYAYQASMQVGMSMMTISLLNFL